jgi:hypothetical protein
MWDFECKIFMDKYLGYDTVDTSLLLSTNIQPARLTLPRYLSYNPYMRDYYIHILMQGIS